LARFPPWRLAAIARKGQPACRENAFGSSGLERQPGPTNSGLWRTFMKLNNKVVAGFLALLFVLSVSGCKFLKARDELNKGIRSIKDAKYESAIEHFKQSIELDPNNDNAYLYLAFAYASQFVPGGASEENNKIGMDAIKAYDVVLQRTPTNSNAAKGIAGIYFNMKEFEKSKEYHKKVSELEPTNPEPFYSMGNINWWLLFIHKDYPPEQKTALINEGMEALKKSTKLNPGFADAFFYINLMHRQQAQVLLDDFVLKNPKMKDKFPSPMDASSPIVEPYAKKLLPPDSYKQYKEYLDMAEQNWQKAMQLRKENEAKAESKGVVDTAK
jgi:tetratricopeptide (TPR) repeat protein